jgi:predicted small secreted protein
MKMLKGLVTAILLLMAFRIAGCSLETTEDEGRTTPQSSQGQQEQEVKK